MKFEEYLYENEKINRSISEEVYDMIFRNAEQWLDPVDSSFQCHCSVH